MSPLPHRNERGVVAPSPVVMLSVVAVAMAAIAFVATRGSASDEQDITSVAREESPSASITPGAPVSSEAGTDPGTDASADPSQKPRKHRKPPPPAVERSKVYVAVFNNSSITGLAGRVAGVVGNVGWKVVGTDNWYGAIPATTVYYPPDLKKAGEQLALDLGISRVMPAVDPMRSDRLSLILTGELD